MSFSNFILFACLLTGQAWTSNFPGLTCPNPDFAALLVRVNYLEIEVKSCKDLVNGIENLDELTAALETIEGLKTLPDDLADLKEDTDDSLAALGGSVQELSDKVDGLDSSVSSLNDKVSSLESDLADQIDASTNADQTLQSNIDALSGTVDDLSTSLNDGISSLKAADAAMKEELQAADAAIEIGLQSNIDGVKDACDNKIEALEGQLADEVTAREAEVNAAKEEVQAACDAKLGAEVAAREAAIAAIEEKLQALDGELTAEAAAREADVTELKEKTLFIFGEWGEWSSCDVTCDLGRKTRTRECPGNDCASMDGKGSTDLEVCDSNVLCPYVDSGKLLIVGGLLEGSSAQKVSSEVVDVRSGQTCTAPEFRTDYREGTYGALLWNKYAVVMGGDAVKEEIHVFRSDGTITDVKVEGEGKSRKYAAAITLADKKSLYVVGGYYSGEGDITKSTEVITLSENGTYSTGKSGPEIPKKLVNHCFTTFNDDDGNRNFFLFGGSQTVAPSAGAQASDFSTSGWVLKESAFDPDDPTSWDNAVSTPTDGLPSDGMPFITCTTFKNGNGKEQVMIIGDQLWYFDDVPEGTDPLDKTNAIIYQPDTNTFVKGPYLEIDSQSLVIVNWYKASLYASTQVANEIVLTGGQGMLSAGPENSYNTEDIEYSKYKFKLKCEEGVTNTADCKFELMDQKLDYGRRQHITFHVPDPWVTCT